MTPRTQTAIAFLASAVALAFVTHFVTLDVARPFLEGAPMSGPAYQAFLAKAYPFAAVTEVRIAYCVFGMLPILLPVIGGGRLSAWATLAVGVVLTLVNMEDAVSAFLLDGRPALGAGFIVAVGGPGLIGIISAWRWVRESRAAR